MTRARTLAEWERLEYRALMVLTDHVSRTQAIANLKGGNHAPA